MISKPRYSIEEVVDGSGNCRSVVYADIRAGLLAVVKHGRRTFVLHDELMRYCATPLPRAASSRQAA